MFLVSNKGYQRLLDKKKQIQEDMITTQKRIGEVVKIDNDLRENPEYMEYQNRATYLLPKQLQDIEHVLSNCKVIDLNYVPIDIDTVQFGSIVEIEDEDGNTRKYTILGYGESKPNEGIISYLTPLGAALMDKKVGDEVSVLPKNKIWEIISITSINQR